ncbi:MULTISPECIES: hypothetical protein [Ralstonia]|jgi:hypothetical protein|uniref:hypothetical protein n=1 Tax=Ralstonia TaxID=48736 RepID=UPI0021756FAC|nr:MULTISPECIES: hypothetical protein [Ralstonia]MDR9383809.1 hypothetical protein [Ralstonia sp. 11b]
MLCTDSAGRGGTFYWDENNVNTPNFHQSQTSYLDYRTALGNGLPILWWQTPLGMPSSTPGGTNQHYRDNRVDYMLRNTQEYGNGHTFANCLWLGRHVPDDDQHRRWPVRAPARSVCRRGRGHAAIVRYVTLMRG